MCKGEGGLSRPSPVNPTVVAPASRAHASAAPNLKSQCILRDPLDRLAPVRFPPKETGGGFSRRAQQEYRQRCDEINLCNNLKTALKSLWHGRVAPDRSSGRPSHLGRPSKGDLCETERLHQLCADFRQRVPASGASQERAAFRRLTRTGGLEGDAGPAPDSYGERGVLVPAIVERISVPQAGAFFDVTTVPEVSAHLGGDILSGAPDKVLSGVPCYSDPRLVRNKRGQRELALRLFGSGLLRPVKKKGNWGVRVFTVRKSPSDKPDHRGVVKTRDQRLVFDCRRANREFVKPPACALGSLESMGKIRLPAGGYVCAGTGDVKDCFYALALPLKYSERLWLQDVDFSIFCADAIAEGYPPEIFEGADALGFAAPPMGWSWSPWIAQQTLEFLLESGPTGRLHHGDPAVDLEKETPGAHWAYLDDYGRIFWRADREAADQAAGGYQQRAAGVLRGQGFGVHKEQCGGEFEVLGGWFRGEDRVLLPAPEKFRDLIFALRYLTKTRPGKDPPQVRPKDVERLLGRATWFSLLRRETFSAFAGVYDWLQSARKRGVERVVGGVPRRVLAELRLWVSLAPCVRAELSLPFHPVGYLSDACEKGVGWLRLSEPPRTFPVGNTTLSLFLQRLIELWFDRSGKRTNPKRTKPFGRPLGGFWLSVTQFVHAIAENVCFFMRWTRTPLVWLSTRGAAPRPFWFLAVVPLRFAFSRR